MTGNKRREGKKEREWMEEERERRPSDRGFQANCHNAALKSMQSFKGIVHFLSKSKMKTLLSISCLCVKHKAGVRTGLA